MKIRYGPMRALTLTLMYGFLILGSIATIFPFVWMLLASFKKESEMFSVPVTILPQSFIPDNYQYVWNTLEHFPNYVFNSIFVTASCVLLHVFFDSLAAFAFSKLQFPGRDRIFTLFLLTMLIPAPTLLIALYGVIKSLGWLDTYLALIVPQATSVFGIFIIWQYMKTIPNDYLEAARLDGASDFMIYWKIYLPLSTPALATLAIFTFITVWNDYLWPLLVTSQEEMRTLTVGVALLQSNNVFTWVLLMTGASISVIPVILFYLFAQRYFIGGLTAGSVKG